MRALICLGLILVSVQAHALNLVPYNAKSVEKEINAGRPHVLFFFAEWCSICQSQKSLMKQINDDSTRELTVFLADFDLEKKLKADYGIERQSTLIVFRGKVEFTRSLGLVDQALMLKEIKKAVY